MQTSWRKQTQGKLKKKGGRSTNEPMPSGEEDIEPSNPPTEIEPDVTTVAELGESEEEAKD